MANTEKYLNHLLQNTGITPACSEEERAASDLVADIFRSHGFEPEVQEFTANGTPKVVRAILGIVLFLGAFLMGFSGALGVFGFLFAVAAAVVFGLERAGRIDFFHLGSGGLSQNVIAHHVASGPMASPRNRPVVVVAHYDSPRADLFAQEPFAAYRPLVAKFLPYAMIVPAAIAVVRLLPLPGAAKAILWVLAILAALVPLANAVAIIANRFFTPYTSGSVCNKSSVAAMLGVMDAVAPWAHGEEFPNDEPFEAYMGRQSSLAASFAVPSADEDVDAFGGEDGDMLGAEVASPEEVADEDAAVPEAAAPVVAPVPTPASTQAMDGVGIDAGLDSFGGADAVAPMEDDAAPVPASVPVSSEAASEGNEVVSEPAQEDESRDGSAPETEEPVAPEPQPAAVPVNALGNIRYGSDVIHSLGMVPVSCRVVYVGENGTDQDSSDDGASAAASASAAVPAAPVEAEPASVVNGDAVEEEANAEVAEQADDAAVPAVTEMDEQVVAAPADGPATSEAYTDMPVAEGDAAPATNAAPTAESASEQMTQVTPGLEETPEPEEIPAPPAGVIYAGEATPAHLLYAAEYADAVDAVVEYAELDDEHGAEEPSDMAEPRSGGADGAGAAPAAEGAAPTDPQKTVSVTFPIDLAADEDPASKASANEEGTPEPAAEADLSATVAMPAQDDQATQAVSQPAETVDSLMAQIQAKSAPAPRPQRSLNIPSMGNGTVIRQIPPVVPDPSAYQQPVSSNRTALFDIPDPATAPSDPFASSGPIPTVPVSAVETPTTSGFSLVTPEDAAMAPTSEPKPPAPVTIKPEAPVPKKERHGLGKLFGRKKDKQESMGEWLGVGDDFDAKRTGGEIGSWDNFDSDDDWKGGATGAEGVSEDELRDAITSMGDDELLGHDIWFVATGASEYGNAGMKAFLSTHREYLRGVFLINLESVGAGRLAMLATEGENHVLKGDKRIMKLVSRVSSAFHGEIGAVDMPFIDTDAHAAMELSLRALTLAGIDATHLACSHNEEDQPFNIDPRNVNHVANVVTEVIRRS